MSFKLVKNAAGKVIAYGPGPEIDAEGEITADHYDPTVPPGCTLEIVEDYVHVLDPKEVAQSAVVKLEVDNPITHRTLRETLLAVGQLVEKATGRPAAANTYYAKLASLDAQISALANSVRGPQ